MKIAPDCELPDHALRQHIAVLGKTGSGKTYTAKGLVEKLLDEGRRVCVLDPTGAWWGLKASADGKAAGYPVAIFGGDHADVPITEHAGAALGELVGTGNVPSIIDLSGTTLGERHRFVERFAEALYRVNRQPLHLIIDEADEFAPQSGAPGTERMLGAIDRIVRRGRIKGFRVMLISQRPAVLNKNVLTQAETMIAMRLPASQDRKAIELWIKGQADEDQAEDLLKSLSGLHRGEGWVWSPANGVLLRCAFPRIETFDSSRTPDDGEALPAPKKLADVDLTAIKAAMDEAVKEAEANDPKKLRAELAETKRKLADALKTPVTMDPANVEARIDDAVRAALHVILPRAKVIADALDGVLSHARQHLAFIEKRLQEGGASKADQDKPVRKVGSDYSISYSNGHAPARNAPVMRAAAPRGNRPPGAAANGLKGPQKRILDACAWWAGIGVEEPTRAQVGFVARIKPTGGHFSNSIGPLTTGGYLEPAADGAVRLTDAGREAATWPDRTPSLADYHDGIREVLQTGAQVKLLNAVIEHGVDRTIPVERLGELTGIDSAGGHFSNSIGPLSTLGLITRARGMVEATDLLFPEGLR